MHKLLVYPVAELVDAGQSAVHLHLQSHSFWPPISKERPCLRPIPSTFAGNLDLIRFTPGHQAIQ